ncbi:MAG: hypothetical protein DCF30_07565 [Hyphomicrobiales bacterium]|nr:MAG: hypothetical protein DCF30_07565 [Hyphomicrobiales bacterium]
MRRLLLLCLLLLAAWSAWTVFVWPSYEHRFRISIAVDTPEGLKQHSSVWSVTCSEPIRTGGWGVMTGRCTTRGEAVFVDLGQGRNLIGLMARGALGDEVDVHDIAAVAFDRQGVPKNRSWYPFAPTWSGVRELRGNNIPTLATFSDLNEPGTGRVVPATDAGFASAFGPDYRLASVALEAVPVGLWPFNLIGLWGTPLTHGIEQRVPFLVSQRDQLRRVNRDMPPRYQTEFSQFLRE